MSLLLDALKRAAQEKLKREQQENELNADSTVIGADSTELSPASDKTEIDPSTLAQDDTTGFRAPNQHTQIDDTQYAEAGRTHYPAASDKTVADHTQSSETVFGQTTKSPVESSRLSQTDGTVLGNETHITEVADGDKTVSGDSTVAPSAHNTVIGDRTDLSILPDENIAPDSTAVATEHAEATKPAELEQELELEALDDGQTSDDSELELDSDVFNNTASTELQRARAGALASELEAFLDTTKTGPHGVTTRATDYTEPGATNQYTDTGQQPPASLTENLHAQQVQYHSSRSDVAAQFLSGGTVKQKRPKHLYIMLGLGVVFGGFWIALSAIDYFTELDQSQIRAPLPRSETKEPLSAALSNTQTDAEVVADTEVLDPELLIEQEDYSQLLEEDAYAEETYEELESEALVEAAIEDTPAETITPKATSKPSQTVAGTSGQYSIQRSVKPRGEPLSQVLMRGYTAYQAANYLDAEIAYKQALNRSPRNRDALLGMAAIQVVKGDTKAARSYYSQLLVLNPRDDVAISGLASVQHDSRQADVETTDISKIKTLLQEKPDSAPLHFSLGNAYAAQRRWANAQQAYFAAMRLASDNPDYSFNLAVSLDHLGQTNAARQYYNNALQLSNKNIAHFDKAMAESRMRALATQ